MTIQEAIKSGKPFKRKYWKDWIKRVKDYCVWATGVNKNELANDAISINDILADDWEVKEEWYEGDFKKKYPNGVLCWVWNSYSNVINKRVVIDYIPEVQKFKTDTGTIVSARPVLPSEAPAIIGEDDDI